MSQLSYSTDTAAYGIEGQLADSAFKDAISALAEGAIPMGKLVIRGTDPVKQGKLPGASGDVTTAAGVLGVSIHDQAREADLAGVVTNLDKSAVSVLRRGRIVVKTEEAVTPADPVVVRFSAGGLGVGSFAKTAGAAHAALAGAKWMSSAAANGFAVLELTLS